MPTVTSTLEYLQKLPLYETEKPYWCFLPPHDGFDPDTQRVNNLEFEEHAGIEIKDIRDAEGLIDINTHGFQVSKHKSKFSQFESAGEVAQYRDETEKLLMHELGAVFVKCYDSVLRKNVTFYRDRFDLADPLHREGPARGVHNGENYTEK